jgi:hypothetical protein
MLDSMTNIGGYSLIMSIVFNMELMRVLAALQIMRCSTGCKSVTHKFIVIVYLIWRELPLRSGRFLLIL